ncbi:MAG TPA: hypothetical protein VIH99_00575 [Bdellovibrionota bacterium]|jgi:hypothetical protein
MVVSLLLLTSLFAPSEGKADPFAGLTVSMTYPRNLVTHYSATPRGGPRCRLEHGAGGPDESPSGLRPLQYRIDKPGMHHGRPTVLAAVPQKGGNSGIFGCFFSLPDAHPGVLFYAGDRYGPDSNYQIKTDVSSPCTSIVNEQQRSRLLVYNCPGRRGGSAPPIPRDSEDQDDQDDEEDQAQDQPQKKSAPAPAPKDPEQDDAQNDSEKQVQPEEHVDRCPWLTILTCDSTPSEAARESARLGGGFSIIHTNDYSNFRPGWYCVALPASSQSDANMKTRLWKRRAPHAYPKKGC